MKRTKRIIALLLKFGTLISAAGFIGSTLIQIYARFFMESAPSWTEEAARFFFIYAMSFAAGLAMKDKYYVHLDLVYDKLKENQKKVLDLNISIIVFMMFLIMSPVSSQMMKGIYCEPWPMIQTTSKEPQQSYFLGASTTAMS